MALRHVLLLQRDVPRAARLFTEGLGLVPKVVTEKWAELDSAGTTIALMATEGYAMSSTQRYLSL